MINKEISSKVLTVGLQYQNHRGGIGGVIEVYQNYFANFNFICTYGITNSKSEIVFNFMRSIVNLFAILIKNKKIELVHIHGAAKGSVFRKYVVFNICKRVFGKKVIYHSHASEMEVFFQRSPPIVKWLCRDFFNSVDIVICLSRSWESFYTANFNCKKIEILENIVPEQPLKKVKPRSVPLRLLFLGRIGQRKGIFDLVEVISENKHEFEDKIRLTIGGDGEGAKLTKIIEEQRLQKLIDYRGWISGRQKEELLQCCDVYILPSYNEGLPISILEAMSYGLVIVSTTVGGIPEIINDNKNGYLFEPGDKKEILGIIRRLMEGGDLFDKYRNRSYEVITDYYPSKVIPKLEKIYRSLTDKK